VARVRVQKQPKSFQWKMEWVAHTCVEKILGNLPGPWVFRLGEFLGGLAWHFMTMRRHVVLRNLRIAFHGEHDLPTLQKMARESFRRTGANLFSTAHTARLPGDQIDAVLEVENQDLIEEAMAGGKGLVLMPSHMGNWEILSRMNRLFPQGYKIGAFYRPLNNPYLDARVVEQRATDGTRLFSKRDSLHQVNGFLRDGGLIGILADQRVGRQGELVRFFGRLTRASTLPSLMTRRSKSSVLTISLITDTPGKWRVRYHSVNPPLKTPDCMEALEKAMRASPLDVFWMQERWKLYITPSYTIRDWLGPDAMGVGKPHRAMLWLVDLPAEWEMPETWTHPDVIYELVLAPNQATPAALHNLPIIHRCAPCRDRDELQKAIAAIDLAAALPVDYILTHSAPKVLMKAARRESIPVISLP
jgi:Kdo2-lipid IVA lauroyltransferase/acyltransferase